jgi:tetratricopeptide (TPR) repeat protein
MRQRLPIVLAPCVANNGTSVVTRIPFREFDMPIDPREPIDAILVTDEWPPPRRTRRWLLGGGCLFACLACAGLAVWLLARFYGVGGPSANHPVVQWESAAEKQAALLRAFDGRRRTLQDPDLAEIQRLLRRVAATAGREDNAEFQKLVDFGRMVQRIQSHAGVERINWLERQILASQVRTECDGPANAQDFRIACLERPAEDHVVVYAYAVNTEVSGDPFKFWLARTRDGWRVYDWERIELGWSEATQYARLQIAAAHPHSDSYDEGSEELVAADESTEEGEYDEAAEHVQAAARHAVPPVVADFWCYLVAIRWSSLDRSDECLAWCRRAQNPDEIPGFYTLQAVHLQQTERHEEALAAIENYERVAGFQPEVVRMKAESLNALRRREDALACWRQLVQFTPDGMNDLSEFCEALPAAQRVEVLDIIQTAERPVEVASRLAQRWICREDGQLLIRLQQFVAARSPGSPEALQLEGQVLQYEGEYEQAADRFRQAAEQELDPEKRDGCWSSFLQAMVDAGQIVPAYEVMPDPREAFQRLAGGIEDGDAMIDYDQLPPLLAAHRRRCPDDAWLHYFAGLWADQNNEPEQAAGEFAAAEKSEDEEVKSSAGYQLRDLLCRQGKVLEAYRRGSDEAEIFRELAGNCRFNDDPQGLQDLLKTRRATFPTSRGWDTTRRCC